MADLPLGKFTPPGRDYHCGNVTAVDAQAVADMDHKLALRIEAVMIAMGSVRLPDGTCLRNEFSNSPAVALAVIRIARAEDPIAEAGRLQVLK